MPAAIEEAEATPVQTKEDQLEERLGGSHLALIPAGVPGRSGVIREDLSEINAGIAKGFVEACAKHCPEAILGMIVNFANSVVPAMAELYEKIGLYQAIAHNKE